MVFCLPQSAKNRTRRHTDTLLLTSRPNNNYFIQKFIIQISTIYMHRFLKQNTTMYEGKSIYLEHWIPYHAKAFFTYKPYLYACKRPTCFRKKCSLVPSIFFYPDFIQILSRFYQKSLYPNFDQIFLKLAWYRSYPDFITWIESGKNNIKSG